MDDPVQVEAYAQADFSAGDSELISRLKDYQGRVGVKDKEIKLIFDLGCGPGFLTEKISSYWPLAEVVGIDGSQEMLAIATKREKETWFYFSF